jgi:ParB-like chromosome segregation protein Spo0J
MLEPKEMSVALDLIEVGDRMRKPDLTVIAALAADMADHGQLQRIGLCERTDGRYDLIWGRNRIEAAGALTWPTIDARVYPPDTPDRLLKVLEIVENLRRQELTPDERQAQTLELAAAIKERDAETRGGTDFMAPTTGRGHKGVYQKVAELQGVDHSSVRHQVEKASEAIGEPVDLRSDTPEELRRKADKRRNTPKVAPEERRERARRRKLEKELEHESVVRIDLRQVLENEGLSVEDFCELARFWDLRGVYESKVENFLNGDREPRFQRWFGRKHYGIGDVLEHGKVEGWDLAALKAKQAQERAEASDAYHLKELQYHWVRISEKARREFIAWVGPAVAAALLEDWPAEPTEQTSEISETDISDDVGEPQPDGPTEVAVEGNGAEPPTTRICAELGCDEVFEVPAGKRGRPPTRCPAHRRPARGDVTAETETELEERS